MDKTFIKSVRTKVGRSVNIQQ